MKITKTAALKGALLTVLAANISWQHLEFSSVEMASERLAGRPAATASAPAAAASAPAARPEAAKAAPAANKPSLPPRAPTVFPMQSKICGEDYTVQFVESKSGDGRDITYVRARKASAPANGDWDVQVEHGKDIVQVVGEKESALQTLANNVKAYRTTKNEPCVTTSVRADAPAGNAETRKTPEQIAEEKEAKAKEAEEKALRAKEIADQVKNCTHDRQGKELNRGDKVDCLTTALENVHKRVERRGADKKLLSERELARAVMSEIQRLHKELKRQVKGELMAKDSDSVESAKSALTRAMDAIVDQASSFDLGGSKTSSNNTVSKLVKELSALKHGAETREEAEKYAERGSDISANLRDSFQRAMASPLDPFAINDLNNARNQFESFRWELGANFEPQFMLALQQSQRQGFLSTGDYNDFTKPYVLLQNQMRQALNGNSVMNSSQNISRGQITGSVLGDDFQVPSNLASLRSVGTGNQIVLGGSIPLQRPNITLPNMPTMQTHAPQQTFTPGFGRN